jgi:serine/tyrosine/threonine adenylyltransferase
MAQAPGMLTFAAALPLWITLVVGVMDANAAAEKTVSPVFGFPFSEWSFSPSLNVAELPLDRDRSNTVRWSVRHAVFSVVAPTPFRGPTRLVALSDEVAVELEIDPGSARTDPHFREFAGGGPRLPAGAATLAHCYGGHQFGVWSNQLGDGRAVLLGERVSVTTGQHLELNLKGSGKTPYSRRGDGRAVLRSPLREFLASEAMHALGVPTSRTLSLLAAESLADRVMRDPLYDNRPAAEPAAMVVRVAPSWLRFGSFEIHHANRDIPLLRTLADFALRHYFADLLTGPEARRDALPRDFATVTGVPPASLLSDLDPYAALLLVVTTRTADLLAQWTALGFAHGVLNTDNFSVLGLTIDYGPFAFMEATDWGMVPNQSDNTARYAMGRQPLVGLFNVERLYAALRPLFSSAADRLVSADLLRRWWWHRSNTTIAQRLADKLGLRRVLLRTRVRARRWREHRERSGLERVVAVGQQLTGRAAVEADGRRAC